MTLGFADQRFHNDQLRPYLTKSRFKHCEAVAELSFRMAQHWKHPAPDNAWLAGLYHDIAKDLDDNALLAKAIALGLIITHQEKRSMSTLHAPVGALMVRHECGITDRQILGAIRWHTTGRAKMTLLEKIVYLADIVEAGKKVEHGLIIKKLVYQDINAAIRLTAKETLKHLLDRDKSICPRSLECYNAYSSSVI